jgi:chemotaxis protein methyltransferase CheR
MTDADFLFLQDMLYRKSGLSLTKDKAYLLESRLGTLCRKLKIESREALVQQMRATRNAQLEMAVIEAMTTNETLFFRDRVPFDTFRTIAMPETLARNAATRTIRIWCAAASSGQEAYSIAMILDDMQKELAGWRIDIIGTDISGEVLEKARTGVYSQFEIQRGLPVQQLLKYFSQEGDQWRVNDRLRAMVRFETFNLLDDMGKFGMFDVIFCRNVMIYFDLPTKVRTMKSLSERLKPEGCLFLGAAETVIGISDVLAPDRVNRGLYRRTGHATAHPVHFSPRGDLATPAVQSTLAPRPSFAAR